jgi:hypothetical protein
MSFLFVRANTKSRLFNEAAFAFFPLKPWIQECRHRGFESFSGNGGIICVKICGKPKGYEVVSMLNAFGVFAE